MLGGTDITPLSRSARARRGLAVVPEGGALFPGLTVAENLVVGERDPSRQQRKETVERAAALFPFMAKRWNERAGMLSGGEQQMVSLSRVLVRPSSVVVIDELSHGLAPAILDQLFAVLASFRGEMTLVLIEQYVKRAHELADDVVVLSYGEVALHRPAAEVRLAEIEDAYELRRGGPSMCRPGSGRDQGRPRPKTDNARSPSALDDPEGSINIVSGNTKFRERRGRA